MIKTNWNANNTSKMIGLQECMDLTSGVGNDIADLFQAFGIDDINILTESDLIWLGNAFINLGKIYGIRQERARRNNGK